MNVCAILFALAIVPSIVKNTTVSCQMDQSVISSETCLMNESLLLHISARNAGFLCRKCILLVQYDTIPTIFSTKIFLLNGLQCHLNSDSLSSEIWTYE